jgi:hypothetical protein
VIVNYESTKSHATKDGLFLYTYINSALKYNFVLYSTISESYYKSGSPQGTIMLYYGQIAVISSNCSDNIAYYASSYYLSALDNSDYSMQLNYSTEDAYMHYCYIINDYANNMRCIGFYSYNHLCEECNVINNSQGKNDQGTLKNGGGTLTINKCCLIKNNENGSGTYLFYVESGTMYVKECKIQNGYQYANSGKFYTSYSNTVAGSECAAITNCGTKNVNTKNDQCQCTVYDFEILHKLQKIYLNKQFYYK